MDKTTWGSSSREVARRLVRSAIKRNAAPGDRLADEASLIAQLRVSRATLREGLRLLAFLGAAKSRFGPGGGIVVALPDGAAVASSLAMALQGRRTTVRTVLDGEAALLCTSSGLAADRAPDLDRRAEMSCFESLERDADLRSMLLLDARMASWTTNAVLDLLTRALGSTVLSTGLSFDKKTDTSELTQAYRRLVSAIVAGDRDAAQEQAREIGCRRVTDIERSSSHRLDEWITWPSVDESLEMKGMVLE